MKKILILMTILILTPFLAGAGSYNYSYWGDAIHSAPGMTFTASINAEVLGVNFISPEDLVVFEDMIYVIDSDANSLVVINSDFQKVEELTIFEYTQEYIDLLALKGITDETSTTLNSPYGVDVTESGIFICDTSNLRIVKLNHDYEVVNTFSDINDPTFKIIDNNPVPLEEVETFIAAMVTDINSGNDVDQICADYFDSEKLGQCREIVNEILDNGNEITETELTNMGEYWSVEFIRNEIITDTLSWDIRYDEDSNIIANQYNDAVYFEPKKITVDPTDRMYVVAKNVYEGILEINSDGAFNRFTGVNPIRLTPFEIFSRALMTEEQIAQLQLFLPTEYTNVSIDDRNFIYATSQVSENNAENPIQLINPKGVDVIKRNGYFPPMGDIQYVVGMNSYVVDGPSTLVDIASTEDGIYTVLDQKRSRLFTYDSEGNLLYIDGDEGRQIDKFSEGVAIDYFGDQLLVLDRKTKTIVVYGLTEFGAYVNQAIHYHNQGMFEEAASIWEEVIKINSNYEIAYNGIGKMLLREGDFRSAMDYFELGHDQYYYSKAFKEYRNAIIKDNFGFIIGGLALVAVVLIGNRIRKVYKRGGSILYED